MFCLDISQPIVGRKLTHVLAVLTKDPASFIADADRAEFLRDRDGKETFFTKLAELKMIYRKAAIGLKRRDEYQNTVANVDGTTRVRIVRPQKNNPYRKKYVQAAANHRKLERIFRAL